MKYASGEEPMVGDVVAVADNNMQFHAVGCATVERIEQFLYGILANNYWWPASMLRLVRRASPSAALPFIDGSDVFHVAEKPDSRFDEGGMYRSERTVYEYDGDRLVFEPGQMVAKDKGGVEWLRSSMGKPGTCWREVKAGVKSELDTLREKLRAAEAKLEAVREAVR